MIQLHIFKLQSSTKILIPTLYKVKELKEKLLRLRVEIQAIHLEVEIIIAQCGLEFNVMVYAL